MTGDRGENPRRTIFVRVSPDLQREIQEAARTKGWTINRWAENAMRAALRDDPPLIEATSRAVETQIDPPEDWVPTFDPVTKSPVKIR